MGILEISLLIGAIIGAGLIAGAVAGELVKANVPDAPEVSEPSDFRSPRANYGEAVPFIFGRVQMRSPICIYPGPVTRGDPFEGNELTADGVDDPLVQYWSTIDLLIAERIVKNGEVLGTVTLNKIWYGSRYLWDGSQFANKVQSSGTLLEFDPNVNDPVLFPGGVTDPYTRGSGWWYGGLTSGDQPIDKYKPVGPMLGGYTLFLNAGTWEQGLGLEKVRFYSGQTGVEVENEVIRQQVVNTTGSLEEHYPSYPKFVRLVFEEFVWGAEAQIEDISVDVTFTCPAPEIGDTAGIMLNGMDVNPVSVLYQLFTCEDFCGSDKIAAPNIDSFTLARQTVYDEGLGISYRLQSSTEAGELVKTILNTIDGLFYQHTVTGEIFIILNRPITEEPPKFNQTHLTKLNEISKTTWVSTYSQLRLTFEQRDFSANDMGARNVAVAKDPGLANSQGATETLEETFATIYDPEVANKVAAKRLSNANTPLIKLEATFNRTQSLNGGPAMQDLRPGDVFLWDHPPLGIVDGQFRILKMTLGELDSNAVTVSAIEDKYQAPNFVDPPGGNDVFDPPLVEVQIETHRMITAPYYFARNGLSGDARFQVTTSPVYDPIGIDGLDPVFARNYDRFLILAKRPSNATKFLWQLLDSDSNLVHSMQVPYTETGDLHANMTTPADSGLRLNNLSPSAIQTLMGEDCLLLVNDEFIMTRHENVSQTGVPTTSVVITGIWRKMLDSPEFTSTHVAGTTVWILRLDPNWAIARMSPLYHSSNEEAWDFYDAGGPGDDSDNPLGSEDPLLFNQFQTLLSTFQYTVQNVDSTKRNVAVLSDLQQLDNRANRCLPIRNLDLPSSSVSVSSAATSFGFNFEPFTAGWSRLHQQREFAKGPPKFPYKFPDSLLLNPTQSSDDAESIELWPDYSFSTTGLEIWYEYTSGPLAGTLRRTEAQSTGNDGSYTSIAEFTATAESTNRSITCYIRAVFKTSFGDFTQYPTRYSRARRFNLSVTRV